MYLGRRLAAGQLAAVVASHSREMISPSDSSISLQECSSRFPPSATSLVHEAPIRQLERCAPSTGATYEEARGADSSADARTQGAHRSQRATRNVLR